MVVGPILQISLAGLFIGAGPVTFDPPEPRLGDLVIIYLQNKDSTLEEVSVKLLGYEVAMLRVGPDMLRATAAVPIDLGPGKYPVRVVLPESEIKADVHIVRREFETAELRVNRKFTRKKSKALRARLKREAKQFQNLWDAKPTQPRILGNLVAPVVGRVTGFFGTQRVFNNKRRSTHYGLDLDGDIGDRISAVAAGRVVVSAMRWASGGTIVLDHGGGLFTMYFHMSRRTRKVGDWVGPGDLLGAVGKTGRVTGPHLHFAVVVRSVSLTGNSKGKPRSMYIDPGQFFTLEFKGDPRYITMPITDDKLEDQPDVGGDEELFGGDD